MYPVGIVKMRELVMLLGEQGAGWQQGSDSVRYGASVKTEWERGKRYQNYCSPSVFWTRVLDVVE